MPADAESKSRSARARRVVQECIRRRAAGETLPDEALEQEYADLLPELADELHKLALFEQAEIRAESSRGTDRSSRATQLPATDSFPGYVVVGEIDRGGQGVVYRAVQRVTQRDVAIKVVYAGADSPAADRARLQREVQILGQLNHANIVKIHECGEADGLLYYTMDYIDGQPLDAFLATRDRSVRAVLELFLKICDAVHAAHLRGVIHRDLKPGNILVDAADEPYVLDFGLAKLAEAGQHSRMLTLTGQFVGSLPWASPEQARGDPAMVDVRTDVYALGVILYQMLTGHFPYDVLGAPRDVLGRILEAEPTRPSTLWRKIDGDVETIVLKCLSKEPTRRYQSAGELGRDIRHYLAGEPIEARRDSTWYVLRKTLRRHRIPVVVTISFVALLAVGLVATAALYLEAERERRSARRQAYVASIAAASAALARQDVATMRKWLDLAPAELRGWEWDYLHAETDHSLAVLEGHRERVWSVAFSPDGRRLASAGEDQTAIIWDLATRQPVRWLTGHTDCIYSVAASADHVVTGSQDGTVRVWDMSSGAALFTVTLHDEHSGYVLAVAASPDGSYFAATGYGSYTRIWDRSGRLVAPLDFGHWATGFTMAFSTDGKHLAHGSYKSTGDGRVRVFDVSNPSQPAVVQEITGHTGFVRGVAFSPDGLCVASGSADGTVRVWNRATGESRSLTAPTQMGVIQCVAYSPDGTRLASGSDDQTIRIWDPLSGKLKATLRGHTGFVQSVAFSPDGALIASGARTLTENVRLWDACADGRVGSECSGGRIVQAAVLRPDGPRLAAVDENGLPHVWDVHGETDLALPAPPGESRLHLSSTGDCVGVNSLDAGIRIWHVPSGRLLFEREPGASHRVLALSDRHVAIYASDWVTTSLYDLESGEAVAQLRPSDAALKRLPWAMFSPDGACAAIGDESGTVVVCELTSQIEHHLAVPGSDTPTLVVFGPDRRSLVVVTDGGGAHVFDAASCRIIRTLRGHTDSINCAAFSPDGTRLATASDDSTCRVWDARTGACLLVLPGHEEWAAAVGFTPDGRRLASGSETGKVRIWDAVTGAELLTFVGDGTCVDQLEFSTDPAGRLLMARSQRGRVWVWDTLPYRDR